MSCKELTVSASCPRCRWVNVHNPLYVRYHDEEWGVPSHDDRYLFEMLVLECFVAGLSWECVLNKRAAFRAAFADFDAALVAAFDETRVEQLMQQPQLIRHRGKMQAAVKNAQVVLQIQDEYGSFAAYAWGFCPDAPVREPWQLRTSSPLSDALSRDLKRRGMLYVGTVTIYSWLQAVGIISAHGAECFKS